MELVKSSVDVTALEDPEIPPSAKGPKKWQPGPVVLEPWDPSEAHDGWGLVYIFYIHIYIYICINI